MFDEPTTGLHVHDVAKLLGSFDALLQQGHSVVVIEHHLDVLKCADHILDLGPGGGKHGGTLVHEGTPESLVQKRAVFDRKAPRPQTSTTMNYPFTSVLCCLAFALHLLWMPRPVRRPRIESFCRQLENLELVRGPKP